MLGFLDHADHFPGRCKDGFIALFLPILNIELPVGGLTADDTGFELGCCLLATGTGFLRFELHDLI